MPTVEVTPCPSDRLRYQKMQAARRSLPQVLVGLCFLLAGCSEEPGGSFDAIAVAKAYTAYASAEPAEAERLLHEIIDLHSLDRMPRISAAIGKHDAYARLVMLANAAGDDEKAEVYFVAAKYWKSVFLQEDGLTIQDTGARLGRLTQEDVIGRAKKLDEAFIRPQRHPNAIEGGSGGRGAG